MNVAKIKTVEEWVDWFKTAESTGMGFKMVPIGNMYPRKFPCIIVYNLNYEIDASLRTCEFYIVDPFSLEDDDPYTK